MPFPDSEYPSILRGRDKRESQRLIAAAPELLAALKNLLAQWEPCIDFDSGDIDLALARTDAGDDARAAIARAEGRSE
jgi:hypothetical protein